MIRSDVRVDALSDIRVLFQMAKANPIPGSNLYIQMAEQTTDYLNFHGNSRGEQYRLLIRLTKSASAKLRGASTTP